MAVYFVKKNCGGGADVERVNMRRHGDGHGVITGGEDCRGDAVAFAAEDHAAISGEIGLRENPLVRVRMRSDAADAPRAQFVQALHERHGRGMRIELPRRPLAEARQFDHGQLQNRAHGIAHRAAQKRAAGGFTHNQRLRAERHAISRERAEVFGVGQGIDSDKKLRMRAVSENFLEGNRRGDFADGEHALEHRKAGERLQ